MTSSKAAVETATQNMTDSPEHFPFMKLPPEIRLLIYELAVQDKIAAAMSRALAFDPWQPKHQPYLGALALIHTTSIIRQESRNAMHAVAYSQWEDLHARSNLSEDNSPFGSSILSRCYAARKQSYRVGDMCTALQEPRLINMKTRYP